MRRTVGATLRGGEGGLVPDNVKPSTPWLHRDMIAAALLTQTALPSAPAARAAMASASAKVKARCFLDIRIMPLSCSHSRSSWRVRSRSAPRSRASSFGTTAGRDGRLRVVEEGGGLSSYRHDRVACRCTR